VGGATEETVIAASRGIVSAIRAGAWNHHKPPYSRIPDRISKSRARQRGLIAGTAFEILSIDTPVWTLGDYIGARLQADRRGGGQEALSGQKRKSAGDGDRAGAGETSASIEANRALRRAWPEAREFPRAIADAFRSGARPGH